MAEAGIRSYALTNTVRHHPKSNRDPTDEEVSNCQIWLEKDIERFQPTLILALGKIAAKGLLSLTKSGLLTPIYYGLHPSATLRSPRYHEKLWETILQIGSILGCTPIKTRIVFPLKTPQEPKRAIYELTLPKGLVVAADIETEADENEGAVVGYSVSDGLTKTWVTGDKSPTYWPYDHTILHNASFDAPFLGVDLFQDSWDDTMLEGYVLRYPELGLKTMGPRLTGIPMIQYNELMEHAEVKKGKSFKRALEAIPDEAVDYAVRDSEVTFLLHSVLSRDPRWAEGKLRWRYENLEKPVAAILSEMQTTGVMVDREGLGTLSDKLRAIAQEHKRWLDDELGQDINVRSPRLGEIIESNIGQPLPRTDTGNIQLDRKTLLQLAGADAWDGDAGLQESGDSGLLSGPAEIAYHILSAREARTLDATFCVGLRGRADTQGIIRCDWKQTVTLTNRLSSGNPNLQNISARSELGKPIRKAFIVPKGFVWLRADFSQVEVRMFAHFTQDPALLACYPWEGESTDVHERVSATLGIARKPAKNGLFETIYGGSAAKFARTVGVAPDRAEEFHNLLLREYPSIARWATDTEDVLLHQGYLETILGHRMYFPTAWSPVSSEKAEALRSAANGRIQGSAADVMKLFMIAAYSLAKKRGAWFLVQVHDELGIACPREEVDALMGELRQLARDIAYDLKLLVPLEVSVGYADNWSEAG